MTESRENKVSAFPSANLYSIPLPRLSTGPDRRTQLPGCSTISSAFVHVVKMSIVRNTHRILQGGSMRQLRVWHTNSMPRLSTPHHIPTPNPTSLHLPPSPALLRATARFVPRQIGRPESLHPGHQAGHFVPQPPQIITCSQHLREIAQPHPAANRLTLGS